MKVHLTFKNRTELAKLVKWLLENSIQFDFRVVAISIYPDSQNLFRVYTNLSKEIITFESGPDSKITFKLEEILETNCVQ